MKALSTCMLTAATLGGLTIGASADILNLSGDIVQIAAPSDLRLHALESSEHMFLMQEHDDLTLSADLALDGVNTGLIDAEASAQPGLVSAGTNVDVYLVHADPVGSERAYNTATITFGVDVLGVIFLTETLAASDTLNGPAPYLFTDNIWRGAEIGTPDPLDWYELSEDRRRLTIHFGTDSAMDEMRIITEVPTPATAMVMLAGLGGLTARRRRCE